MNVYVDVYVLNVQKSWVKVAMTHTSDWSKGQKMTYLQSTVCNHQRPTGLYLIFTALNGIRQPCKLFMDGESHWPWETVFSRFFQTSKLRILIALISHSPQTSHEYSKAPLTINILFPKALSPKHFHPTHFSNASFLHGHMTLSKAVGPMMWPAIVRRSSERSRVSS